MNISEEMSDMGKLSHENLYSLEEYARIRPEFRAQVMAHKKDRRVAIGEHAALYFEDALTMQYQVQEMLRIERIFEARGIQDELDVYNPLIPDGQNWKATFMMEYADVEQRRRELARLIGVDQALWVQVEGFDKVHPVANEDLERTTEDKTASVHFVRFELTPEMAAAAKGGGAIRAGISHPAYSAETVLDENVRNSLVGDLH
jgi:DNA primase large subunit